ncbi:hypothetical protein AT05_09955 [Schleiferia thermophila str. Yellowstone]|nr:hypothetical protein AT05_09955 [Schleiferia thermophila str. Yellowstone]GCD80865.1 hypothetical protein JCM30197_21120 [Schleiferia thermophila]
MPYDAKLQTDIDGTCFPRTVSYLTTEHDKNSDAALVNYRRKDFFAFSLIEQINL